MSPGALRKWLILIAVLYLVFPRDLMPDFIGGGLGLIDDLGLIALLIYFYRRHLSQYGARQSRGQDQGDGSSHAQPAASEDPFDPYEILGIPSSASSETIQAAYRARMKEYHPDKVAHLGEELQELAHRKALNIQRAYQQLRN
jgi:uncharacterized membrane protein YkvA (DUF1232 family)